MPLSFDDLVETFDHSRGLPPAALRAFGALVADMMVNWPEAPVLEPGIGSGRLAAPLLLRGGHVTGVDTSRPMLDRLAAKVHDLPGRCDLVLADATALPFPPATFDVAYVANLFYLVPDWRRVLDELARVVKPGGLVLFCAERSHLSPPLARFDQAWRAAIETAGFHHETAAPDDKAVIRAMSERIGPPEVRSLARWTIGQTVGEALVGYGPRLRPLYAALPEPEWDLAVDGFVTRMRAAFPDPAMRLDCQVSFEVAIARVPSRG